MKTHPLRTIFITLCLSAFLILFIPGSRLHAGNAGLSSFEGTDYSPVYDFEYYTARYTDIAAIYGNDPMGALFHFVQYGMQEGRQGCAAFDARSYAGRYPDLKAAFGDDLTLYYLHYIQHGASEGRLGTGNVPASVPEDKPAQGGTPAGRTVILDAGHGGRDPGAVRNGVYEKNLNFSIIMDLKALLEAQGYTVLLTRPDDSFVSLEYRYAFENMHPEAVFVSVHCNALAGSSNITGMSAYCNVLGNENSPLLASCVYSGALSATGAIPRGVKEYSDLKVVLYSTIPSVLIEVGYMSTPSEFSLLCSPDYQMIIAEGIANGINAYFGATA
ncbi:MAG: N-acetylmuramoyl-L-alanine amidase [Lachnospiraceae bacterium]|nr:N-acetylmuramoyl-L-alanine amidase [Lachnospiraceae bacterium]